MIELTVYGYYWINVTTVYGVIEFSIHLNEFALIPDYI